MNEVDQQCMRAFQTMQPIMDSDPTLRLAMPAELYNDMAEFFVM